MRRSRLRTLNAAVLVSCVPGAVGMGDCSDSRQCTESCGRWCVDDWPIDDDAHERIAAEATRYVACQEEHWGRLDCDEEETDFPATFLLCEPATKCRPLATDRARGYSDCLSQCGAEWEAEHVGHVAPFCDRNCARSCGDGTFDVADAARRAAYDECRKLCVLHDACPALDERYFFDPLRGEVTVAPALAAARGARGGSASDPLPPPRPDERWNFRGTEERREWTARLRDDTSDERTRLNQLMLDAHVGIWLETEPDFRARFMGLDADDAEGLHELIVDFLGELQ
jgi:hypothetical protein